MASGVAGARRFREAARRIYDDFFCAPLPGKRTLGQEAPWTIDTTDLMPASIVYSAGAGNDISFELELMRLIGCRVLLFDPSPTGIRTAQKTENTDSLLYFVPVGVAGRDGVFTFQAPDDPAEGSFIMREHQEPGAPRLECRTLSTLMREHGHTAIDLLKLDIEGAEYAVIDHLFAHEIAVRQICVEFHDFFSDIPKTMTRRAVRRLLDRGYRLIHKARHDHTFLLTR
jgi:FkbM family methyltransferase